MTVLGAAQASSAYVRTRVLVVDDHALFRRGLRIALSEEPDIEVVAECADTPSAVELVLRLRPDVALVDLGTPFEGGIAACAAITAAYADVRVLLLAPGGGDPDRTAAAPAGPWGSLVKDASADEVAAAIRAAADAPSTAPSTAPPTAPSTAARSTAAPSTAAGGATPTPPPTPAHG